MFKTIKVESPEVCSFETGEVLRSKSVTELKVREDVPFRSITDLKPNTAGHEFPTKASIVNAQDYIPIEKMVNMIFRTRSIAEIRALSESGLYDEDAEIDVLEDPIEQMDLIDFAEEQRAKIEECTANAGSEQSAAQATTTKSTQGEGAQSEAVSADIAG